MAYTLAQLLKAIHAEDAGEVKRILSFSPSLAHAAHPRDGSTPLHAAAVAGCLPVVRELLHAGASCQVVDANLEVPLHVACRQRGGAGVVRELLADAGRRSCLRSLNKAGATPLHLAVQAGQLEAVQLLINAGAKTDARDRVGATPLDYVDPRLPGLAQLLQAGRQLTPHRTSTSGGGSGGGAPRSGGRHSAKARLYDAAAPTSPPVLLPRQAGTAAAPAAASPLRHKSPQRPGTASSWTDCYGHAEATGGDAAVAVELLRKSDLSSWDEDDHKQHDHEQQHPQHVAAAPACDAPASAEEQQHAVATQTEAPADASAAVAEQRAAGVAAEQPHDDTHAAGEQAAAAPLAPELVVELPATAAGSANPEGGHAAEDMCPPEAAPSHSAAHAVPDHHHHACAAGHHHHQQQQQLPEQQLQSLERTVQAAHAGQLRLLSGSLPHGPLAMGPLRSGRMMQAAAAAATAGTGHVLRVPGTDVPLCSSLSCGALHGGSSQQQVPQHAGGARVGPRRHSTYDSVAHSWSVALEGSAGLCGAQQQHAASYAAPPAAHVLPEPSLPAGARSSAAVAPAMLPPAAWNHSSASSTGASAQPAARQQHQQPLSGLAAAVAAHGSSAGPLQAPLLAQVSELGGRVARVEAWCEAQVELLPEWQAAMEAVAGIRQQVRDHSALLAQQEGLSSSHAGCLVDLAARLAQLDGRQGSFEDALHAQGQSLMQYEDDMQGLKAALGGLSEQLTCLQEQLVRQAAADGTRTSAAESGLRSLAEQLDAAAARLTALEAAASDTRQQLHDQQTTLTATATLATAAADRSTAAEAAALAAARAPAGGLHAADHDDDGSMAGDGDAAAHPDAPASQQLASLQRQYRQLAATVAGLVGASRVSASLAQAQAGGDGADAGAGAAPLPADMLDFMETVSACLAAHEAALAGLQGMAPKLEGVVAQRAQLINLAEQVASLQAGLNLMAGSGRGGAGGGCGSGPPGSPLGAHSKAAPAGAGAADVLGLASSMVALQEQVDSLTAAVGGLRGEWSEAAAAGRLGAAAQGDNEAPSHATAGQQHEQQLAALVASLQAQQAAQQAQLAAVVAANEALALELASLRAAAPHAAAGAGRLPADNDAKAAVAACMRASLSAGGGGGVLSPEASSLMARSCSWTSGHLTPAPAPPPCAFSPAGDAPPDAPPAPGAEPYPSVQHVVPTPLGRAPSGAAVQLTEQDLAADAIFGPAYWSTAEDGDGEAAPSAVQDHSEAASGATAAAHMPDAAAAAGDGYVAASPAPAASLTAAVRDALLMVDEVGSGRRNTLDAAAAGSPDTHACRRDNAALFDGAAAPDSPPAAGAHQQDDNEEKAGDEAHTKKAKAGWWAKMLSSKKGGSNKAAGRSSEARLTRAQRKQLAAAAASSGGGGDAPAVGAGEDQGAAKVEEALRQQQPARRASSSSGGGGGLFGSGWRGAAGRKSQHAAGDRWPSMSGAAAALPGDADAPMVHADAAAAQQKRSKWALGSLRGRKASEAAA